MCANYKTGLGVFFFSISKRGMDHFFYAIVNPALPSTHPSNHPSIYSSFQCHTILHKKGATGDLLYKFAPHMCKSQDRFGPCFLFCFALFCFPCCKQDRYGPFSFPLLWVRQVWTVFFIHCCKHPYTLLSFHPPTHPSSLLHLCTNKEQLAIFFNRSKFSTLNF